MTIDHTAIALARLPQQFRGKAKIEALLRTVGTQLNEIEVAFQQLLTERAVDTAIGDQLDALGFIVGQPRDGLGDSDYRRYIRARIMTNRSRGTVEDVIRIARLVLGDATAHIEVDLQGVAAYVLRVEDITVTAAVASILAAFLRQGTSAGVRVLTETWPVAGAQTFSFLGGPGIGFPSIAGRQLNDPGLTSNVDTFVRAHTPGAAGNSQTLQFVADGVGAGSLTDGLAAVFHFQSGVTTVGNFETAIASSLFLYRRLAGTPGAILTSPADVKTISMVGGVDGGKLIRAQ